MVASLIALALAGCGGGVPGGRETSAPGSWTRHDLGVNGPRILAVAPGGPGFIGVGAAFPGDDTDSAIYSSADAVAWTVVDEPRPGRSLVAVVAGGPGFVAASSSPPAIWTSPDGQAWTESAPTSEFGDTTTLISLVSTDDLLFAGAHDGLFMSTDGSEWQRADVGAESGTVSGVARGEAGYVAVGSTLVGSMESKGVVWASADGRSWERLPDDAVFARASLNAIAVHDGTLVAVGYASDAPGGGTLFARPTAWTSQDGRTWQRSELVDPELPVRQAPTGALEGAMMSRLAWTAAGWVSVGTAFTAEAETVRFDAAIWTSPDGTMWQRVPHEPGFVAGSSSAMEFGAFSLAVAGGSSVIVGRTTGPQTTIWLNR